jgi:hypothetical protein
MWPYAISGRRFQKAKLLQKIDEMNGRQVGKENRA